MSEMRVVLLREIPQAEEFRRQWNGLVEKMQCPEVFYTWEWAKAVADAYSLALRPLLFAGYRGETAVLLSASDRPVYSQVSQVTRALFEAVGLTVDFQSMDWGSVVTRRTSQNPTDKGGWSAFITALDGVTVSNPGGNFALRGSGQKAWFGWPTDDKLESLRDAWFDATDLASQKAIAEQIQLRGLETLPYIPLGQIFQPTAFRSDIKDIVKAMFPLFWGVRRG